MAGQPRLPRPAGGDRGGGPAAALIWPRGQAVLARRSRQPTPGDGDRPRSRRQFAAQQSLSELFPAAVAGRQARHLAVAAAAALGGVRSRRRRADLRGRAQGRRCPCRRGRRVADGILAIRCSVRAGGALLHARVVSDFDGSVGARAAGAAAGGRRNSAAPRGRPARRLARLWPRHGGGTRCAQCRDPLARRRQSRRDRRRPCRRRPQARVLAKLGRGSTRYSRGLVAIGGRHVHREQGGGARGRRLGAGRHHEDDLVDSQRSTCCASPISSRWTWRRSWCQGSLMRS